MRKLYIFFVLFGLFHSFALAQSFFESKGRSMATHLGQSEKDVSQMNDNGLKFPVREKQKGEPMREEKRTFSPDVLYISHGGGPLPLLGDADHKDMVENLRLVSKKLAKPSAILIISAHWEARIPTITSGKNPSLIYDYYGFPEESYAITYPAKGSPELAHKVHEALSKEGIESIEDDERGFDHGLFIPLKIMYPKADIPCIQLSLVKGLSPSRHIEIGKALSHLDNENLLIIGSGFSFHNMRAFFADDNPEDRRKNMEFAQWLDTTCSCSDIEEEKRAELLENWEKAPSARYCHPREEHLIPLHVCYGVAQEPVTEYFELDIIRKRASVYLWKRRSFLFSTVVKV